MECLYRYLADKLLKSRRAASRRWLGPSTELQCRLDGERRAMERIANTARCTAEAWHLGTSVPPVSELELDPWQEGLKKLRRSYRTFARQVGRPRDRSNRLCRLAEITLSDPPLTRKESRSLRGCREVGFGKCPCLRLMVDEA
jgi:hypothetical protein